MKKIIEELNQIRIDIDVLIGMGEQIKSSRETSTAFTKLQEGRMHIGNTLFELSGVTPPYDNKDPKSERIDPYFQPEGLTPMSVPGDWNDGILTANVKILRRELEKMFARVKKVNVSDAYHFGMENAFDIILGACEFKHEAYMRLREAFNWYGMELGRIRDEQIG